MKNLALAAFIAATAASEVATEVASEEVQKELPQEDSLLNLELCAGENRIWKKTDKHVINDNKRILATNKMCMKWVRSHRRHNRVCRYCAKGVTPSIKWKYYKGVWYRWWSGKWHYYGPSRHGHGGAWKWYGGFWHYRGYVFKYEGGKWWRFYGGKWHYYNKVVHQNPRPPMTKPYCISVYKLVRHGLPASMAIHKVPRCRAGRTIYMWEGSKKCRILGGRKWFMRTQKCKKGRGHKWQKVRRCTRSVVIKAGKVNYKKANRAVFNPQFNRYYGLANDRSPTINVREYKNYINTKHGIKIKIRFIRMRSGYYYARSTRGKYLYMRPGKGWMAFMTKRPNSQGQFYFRKNPKNPNSYLLAVRKWTAWVIWQSPKDSGYIRAYKGIPSSGAGWVFN